MWLKSEKKPENKMGMRRARLSKSRLKFSPDSQYKLNETDAKTKTYNTTIAFVQNKKGNYSHF